MEIATFCKTEYPSRGTFTEILPDVPSNSLNNSINSNANVKLLCTHKSGKKTGVLQAVKLDPAVLEAQVSVDSHDERDVDRISSPPEAPKLSVNFKKMVSMQKAALLSLTPDQLDLLMKYVDTLRRQRIANQLNLECAFCKNNGEPLNWYTSHALRSWRGGKVQCPVLRAYRCPRCGATGDYAHTIKYCPDNFCSDIWSRTSWP